MNTGVVIGIGNSFRRDDGVGLVVAEQVAGRCIRGVRVFTAIGEPGAILDAWHGAALAVVVDAAAGRGATPGRIRRWIPGSDAPPGTVSSHGFGLAQTYALGEALGRLPDTVIVFTVDIAEHGPGVGLSAPVAAAVPRAVALVLAELSRGLSSSIGTTPCHELRSDVPRPALGPAEAP